MAAVTDSQITGQNLLSLDRYDIVAKIPPGVAADQHPAMLQALLAERFKLAVHLRDRKKCRYICLAVARLGRRSQAVETKDNGGVDSHPGYMSAKTITMPRLATFLSSPRAQLEHTVVDHTGLSGTFTFNQEWTPQDKGADTLGPSLVAALQEQLGLKLEAGKASMEILVIDHAEKPSEN